MWTCGVVLLFGIPVSGQEIAFIDLTQVDPNPLKYTKFQMGDDCTGGFFGASVGSSGPLTDPFEFTLINLQQSVVPAGGTVYALLKLENVGRAPAWVPWITDPDEIELPDDNGKYHLVEADLSARVAQGEHGGHFRIPVQLYGSEAVGGSMQEIRPGEWVEIEVKLSLGCEAEDAPCQSLTPGAATLSFFWDEEDRTVTYKDCGTESTSKGKRELTTKTVALEISPAIEPQGTAVETDHQPGHNADPQ